MDKQNLRDQIDVARLKNLHGSTDRATKDRQAAYIGYDYPVQK